jgi:hypothetical protein
MTQSTDEILAHARARVAKATISEEAREELDFQVESFVSRFAGKSLEGDTLKNALAMLMDAFSLAYRMALAQDAQG